jgi:hypothetical protein
MAADLKKEQPSHFASVRDWPQHKLQIKVPVTLHFRFPFRELQTVHFAIDDYFLIIQLKDLFGFTQKRIKPWKRNRFIICLHPICATINCTVFNLCLPTEHNQLLGFWTFLNPLGFRSVGRRESKSHSVCKMFFRFLSLRLRKFISTVQGRSISWAPDCFELINVLSNALISIDNTVPRCSKVIRIASASDTPSKSNWRERSQIS